MFGCSAMSRITMSVLFAFLSVGQALYSVIRSFRGTWAVFYVLVHSSAVCWLHVVVLESSACRCTPIMFWEWSTGYRLHTDSLPFRRKTSMQLCPNATLSIPPRMSSILLLSILSLCSPVNFSNRIPLFDVFRTLASTKPPQILVGGILRSKGRTSRDLD